MASEIVQVTYPELIGHIVIFVSYGFLCSQAWVYYEKFPKDPIRIKVLVIFLLAVVTAHMATNIYRLLNTFGTQFSNVNAFQKADVQWIAISVFSAIASFSVQLFYIHRMMVFSRSRYVKIIALIVFILALFASITSILGGVNEYQGQLEKNTLGGNDEFGEMWLISSAICDILITATMIILLWKTLHSSLQETTTQQIILKLIRQLIETGFVTALFAVVDLGLFVGFPSQIYHFAICNGFPNLYFMTLLTILNGRSYFSKSTSNTKTELSWNVVPGRTHITSSNGQQSNLDDQDSVRPTTSVKELGEPFSSV